ncbi:transposase, partial [Clostridiales Family XIII bacterium PM5-7]
EKFQCILTDPQKKQVLDILPSRKADSLYAYFSGFSNRRQVELVVMDMSSLFRSVAKNTFPHAKIIADKYHVVRLVNWAFENVRKREQKRFHDQRRKYFKGSRRLLLKPPDTLTAQQFEEVSHMLSLSKDLAKAYYLKGEFNKLMKSKNILEAKQHLSNWFMHAGASNLQEFNTCINTFTNWQEEILNAFRYGFTNGYTEGCNNRIKVIKRTAYGMRNFDRFRTRILHTMSC